MSSASALPYFKASAAYAANTAVAAGIALVTGGRSGIGLALAEKLASWEFVDTVYCVSRAITQDDLPVDKKLQPLAADITTQEGRKHIVQTVADTSKPLRFLIHSAGTIEPIGPVTELQPDQLRHALLVNCEAPLLLTTALLPYLKKHTSPRVLHVSSGAAHGAPPVGWGAYGISKAALFQASQVLARELRPHGVLVSSFKPGVVDTAVQATIRQSRPEQMPMVQKFVDMKEKQPSASTTTARPPPKGALDTPHNVAHFAEYLLLGTTDNDFVDGTGQDAKEYDIRDESLFDQWIPKEKLPAA